MDKIKQEFIKKVGYEPSKEELLEYIKNNDELNKHRNNSSNSGSKISGILVIIWFLASFISLILFAGLDRNVELAIVLVQYFLMFGAMAFFGSKNEKSIGWILAFGLALIAFLWLNGDGIKIKGDPELIMVAAMGLIFFLVGMFMLISNLNANSRKKDYVGVNAIICDYSIGRKRTKACVYEYEFNGKKYKITDNFYTNINVPQLGTIKNIYVNPNNPNEILTNSSNLFLILFSLPFIIVGGLLLLVGLGFIG